MEIGKEGRLKGERGIRVRGLGSYKKFMFGCLGRERNIVVYVRLSS